MTEKIQEKISKGQDDPLSVYFEHGQYENHKAEAAILMGHFFLCYLNVVYREFENDLDMPIVLGEIAHHNIYRFYSHKGKCNKIRGKKIAEPGWERHLDHCNTYFIKSYSSNCLSPVTASGCFWFHIRARFKI